MTSDARMINYTERISLLARDIVSRVPRLSYIDPEELLIFARYGRTGAEGAFATCHCISLPPTDPGYYYWRDRQSGLITRRSHWFVTKSPAVFVGGTRIQYLVSFALPRFCDQVLRGSRKEQFYSQVPGWLAKLDTVVHELYHIDPQFAGIRQFERADGGNGSSSHGSHFLETVADMVREYLNSRPDPALYEFLRYGFSELEARYGGVVATTFRTFPSYPQRYIEFLPAGEQPVLPESVRLQPLKTPARPTHFTEYDLIVRQFTTGATRAVPRRERLLPDLVRQMTPPGLQQRAAAIEHDK